MKKALHVFKHFWRYRNPANRTCTFCGKHQIQFARSWDMSRGWWEDMNTESKVREEE